MKLIIGLRTANGETFVWIFPGTAAGAEAVMQSVGRYASDEDLAFTWYDAYRVASECRRRIQEGNDDQIRCPR